MLNDPDAAVFQKPDGKYGFLSNFAESPIIVNGVTYKTAEALFQCAKHPDRPDIQQAIVDAKTPAEAKKLAYKAKCRDDWDDVRIEVMYWVLKLKYLHNTEKMAAEFEKAGDKFFLEYSEHDEFWAAHKRDDGTWYGGNMLGKLLMELKSKIEHEGGILRIVYGDPIRGLILFGKKPKDQKGPKSE